MDLHAKLQYSLLTNEAYGGSDGNQSFIPDIQTRGIDCADEAGTQGELVELACVSHAGGSNVEWTLRMATDKVGVTLKYGNPDRIIKWEVRLFVVPTTEGCPSISIVNNEAFVSDTNYYWGDYIPRSIEGSSIGESDVNKQLPQIATTPPDCYPFNTENYMKMSTASTT